MKDGEVKRRVLFGRHFVVSEKRAARNQGHSGIQPAGGGRGGPGLNYGTFKLLKRKVSEVIKGFIRCVKRLLFLLLSFLILLPVLV